MENYNGDIQENYQKKNEKIRALMEEISSYEQQLLQETEDTERIEILKKITILQRGINYLSI